MNNFLGLFSQVIMQSGSAYSTWGLMGNRYYVPASKNSAVLLGCTTSQEWGRDNEGMLKCMRGRKQAELVRVSMVNHPLLGSLFY